jgi:hypothetical protein
MPEVTELWNVRKWLIILMKHTHEFMFQVATTWIKLYCVCNNNKVIWCSLQEVFERNYILHLRLPLGILYVSWCSDWVKNWDIYNRYSAEAVALPYGFWGPSSPLFNGYRGPFNRCYNSQSVQQPTQLQEAPKAKECLELYLHCFT